MTKYPGRLIAFEGVDGSGKTTQMQRVLKVLQSRTTYPTLALREPGGTRLGEQMRSALKDPENAATARAQLFIVLASRTQQVEHVIVPALAAPGGTVVLIDRFTASTIAYQGYGGGLPMAFVKQACEFATGGLQPHLTLWFDVSANQAQARLQARGFTAPDLFDQQHSEFFERVRSGYSAQHRERSTTWARIDANPDADTVTRQVLEVLQHWGYL